MPRSPGMLSTRNARPVTKRWPRRVRLLQQSVMSATRSKGEAQGSSSDKSGGNSLYDLLNSVRFAVFLLSFLATTSILGTIIRQRASAEEYLTLYSSSTYRIFKFLSLTDVYHSWWFYAALMLLVVNLLLCTASRFRKTLSGKSVREPSLPDEARLLAMEQSFHAQGRDTAFVLSRLGKGYRRTYEGEEGTILERGSLSKYGVLVIHSSIIIILLGSLVGLIWGYRGFIILLPGETKDFLTLRGGSQKEVPLGFSLKCKDFKVSFYPGGEPKDYVTTVDVIENGRQVLEKQIRVNDPLSYKGIHVYQANYGKVISFRFNIAGEDVILKERDTFKKGNLLLMVVRFENMVHDFGPGVLVAYLDRGEPKTAWFLKDVERLRERNIGGVDIRLNGIQDQFYTGLEAARDPGVWVVWTGFAMILFGLYINFFVFFRRIYVRKTVDGVVIAGIAHRNREALKEELEKLKRKIIDES
jgi:cytochrome c biogenesis protein